MASSRPLSSLSSQLRTAGWASGPALAPVRKGAEVLVARASSSVPDSAEPSSGGLLGTLHLGALFGLWYLFNIYFNIYYKQVRKDFPFPITITTCQFAIGTVLILFMWLTNLYRRPNISASQRVAILPLVMVHTLGNLFTNMSLGKVAVSFAHTIKAREPFFSVFFPPCSQESWILLSLVPIVGGVALASMTDASFNWAGFWSAMASNLTFQSRNVLSKKLTVKKEESLDNINLFSIITIMSFCLLAPVTLLVKDVKFTPAYMWSAGLNLKQIYMRSLLAGLCFHAYQQVSYRILARVSPVTHSVGNWVKPVVVVVTSVLFFRAPVSFINSLGNSLSFHRWYQMYSIPLSAASLENICTVGIGPALAGVFPYSKVKRIKPKTA